MSQLDSGTFQQVRPVLSGYQPERYSGAGLPDSISFTVEQVLKASNALPGAFSSWRHDYHSALKTLSVIQRAMPVITEKARCFIDAGPYDVSPSFQYWYAG